METSCYHLILNSMITSLTLFFRAKTLRDLHAPTTESLWNRSILVNLIFATAFGRLKTSAFGIPSHQKIWKKWVYQERDSPSLIPADCRFYSDSDGTGHNKFFIQAFMNSLTRFCDKLLIKSCEKKTTIGRSSQSIFYCGIHESRYLGQTKMRTL